jgi:hypothetical protein
MKYIKTLEKSFVRPKFINNKYVYMSDDALKYIDLYPVIKIIGKKAARFQSFYRTEGINKDCNELRLLTMSENEIERYATDQEIEEFELKKASINYNL